MMRLILKSCLVIATGLITASIATAQGYPDKPVQIVVPFPPGSATDMAARVLSEQLQTQLGQTFVVVNKPGAGGSIGAMDVIRSSPDGYNLMFASNSAIASNVALLKSIPYNPNTDFTPIAGVGDNALVLMVRQDNPATSVQEFIDFVKKRPGKISAGSGSSSSQISAALAINDVISGQVDFTFVDIGNAMAQAKGNRLKALGVTAGKPNSLVPDWAPIAKTIAGYNITAWFGLVGPKGMPANVVQTLDSAVNKALADPGVVKRLGNAGVSPMYLPSGEFKKFIAEEIEKWKTLAKEANIQPE
jgi:tripartite-type tricarboxylate transporter receptor subunit TctC